MDYGEFGGSDIQIRNNFELFYEENICIELKN